MPSSALNLCWQRTMRATCTGSEHKTIHMYEILPCLALPFIRSLCHLPVARHHEASSVKPYCPSTPCQPQQPLDYVYETTVTKDWQAAHRQATVLNRLCGSVVLEDKVSGCATEWADLKAWQLDMCTLPPPCFSERVSLPDSHGLCVAD